MRRQPPPPPPNQQQRQYHHLQKNKSGGATPVVPLYHSTVFRYSCKGRLKLDSRIPTAGVCQGVQSQLQAVEHLRLGTKEEALNYFQQKSALGSIDGDHPHHQPGGAVGQGSDGGGAEALQAAYMSNVLVYPNTGKNQASNENENNNNRKFTPEENTTEKWSCVGNTEVDLLVLRPQNAKEEEIVAVSPYCSPGMTTRDVNTPTLGRDRTSTMRLGFFEIVYVSSTIDEDEDYVEEEETPALPEQHQQQQQDISNKAGNTATQKDAAAAATTTGNNNPKVPATRRRKSTKNPKKEQKSMPIKIYNSGTNIWNHMQINAKLLYQATQDDFANRTLSASKRIVSEFETTKNRTLGLMKKVLLWDWNNDGGDNDGKENK